MSLRGEEVKLAGKAIATTEFDYTDDTDDGGWPAVFDGSTIPGLSAGALPDLDSGPWNQTADFDFLSLSPRQTPPSLAKEDNTQHHGKVSKLDDQEHLGAADIRNVQKASVQLDVLSSLAGKGDKAKDELSTELDDDILSIMCDDNDDNDIFGDDAAEQKRDWSSESKSGSIKRKQDSQSFSGPANIKRSRSPPKTRQESGRSRSTLVHSQLRRPKHHQIHSQSDRDLHRLCFNFTKSGNCFRPSCPFLHLKPSALDNGTIHNRRGRDRPLQNGAVFQHHSSSSHLQKLQQQVQTLQMQTQQQKDDLKSLTYNLQKIETDQTQHAIQQADQVFKQMQAQLHKQQEQHQAELEQTKQIYGQLNQTQDKMEERARVLASICTLLQLVLKQHLQNVIMPSTATGTSRSAHSESDNMLPWPLLQDVRQFSPRDKSDVNCPPRPRSADFENQQRMTRDLRPPLGEKYSNRPQSFEGLNRSSHLPACYAQGSSHAGTPLHQPQNEWPPSRQHSWYLGPTYSNPLLMGDLRVPNNQPNCHVAGNPGIVRLLPVRRSADSAFDVYPHERAPVKPR